MSSTESAGVIMPSYDYACDACGHTAEATHSISYTGGYKCTQCQDPMRKLFSAPAIQFKGGGWGGSGSPKRMFKTTSHSDASSGEPPIQKTEEIGPAIKRPDTAQS
jgi:putative FmdB family regulatory protein